MDIAINDLDRQISHYLGILNVQQKRAILTVAMTFAEEQGGHDYSDELKAELDSRYDEYMNGGNLVNEEEANKRIRNVIEGKPKK